MKKNFRFGDVIENGYASEINPHRVGIFVREQSRGFELTDGKGDFWVIAKDNDRLIKIRQIPVEIGGEQA